jgi:outer membrane biosynthesis protein TonB
MRQFTRLSFRAGFAAATSLIVVFAVACGGDKPEAKNPTTSSGGDDSSNGAAGSSGGSSGSASASGGTDTKAGSSGTSSSGGSSTTTQLGDGGDLQGAKLGGKSHTEVESKGEGGPKSTGGQSANEPGRSIGDIKTIVSARRDEARACYDKGLAAHPGIEGNLDIKWTIDPQGNVTDAALDSAKSQILEPSVANCVIDVIKKIKFAASAKGFETHAHYPFDFHPKTFTPKGANSAK